MYSMAIIDILGNYHQFYDKLTENLNSIGVNVEQYPLSHLGYKCSTQKHYHLITSQLKKRASKYNDSLHNQRVISKIILKTPIKFNDNKTINLIEVMPPKTDRQYLNGLEHLGVVIGKNNIKI